MSYVVYPIDDLIAINETNILWSKRVTFHFEHVSASF